MLYGYNVTKSNWSAGQRFIFLKFLKSKMNKKRRKKTLHSDSISMQGKNSESAHDQYFIDIDIAIAINIDLGSCEHTIAISLIVVIINLWFVVVSVNQLFMQIEENTVHVRVSSLIVRTPIRNILVYFEQLFYTRPSTSFSGHF